MKKLIKKIVNFGKLALAHLVEKISILGLLGSLALIVYLIYFYIKGIRMDEHWVVYLIDEEKGLSLVFAICLSMLTFCLFTGFLFWTSKVLKRNW